jgi:hypothetical protein
VTARRYSGRLFSAEELAQVAVIAADHTAYPTRAAIARAVCAALHWLQPDGRLKQMSCSLALRAMERDGLLTLPPPRRHPAPGPVAFTPASQRQARITGSRADLGPITLRPVADKDEVALWRELVARWHYLGFRLHGGAQLRYLAWDAQGRLLATMEFSASAWKVAPRDRYIGWTAEQRMARLHLVVDHSTFLILPWVKVRFLASSLLAQVARRIPADWRARYGYQPVALETFVDSHRFFGTSYRAAGWRCLGETTGRGRNDRHHRRTHRQPEKFVFFRPLRPDFRRVLAAPLLLPTPPLMPPSSPSRALQ